MIVFIVMALALAHLWSTGTEWLGWFPDWVSGNFFSGLIAGGYTLWISEDMFTFFGIGDPKNVKTEEGE
jgi:hypothetical protein